MKAVELTSGGLRRVPTGTAEVVRRPIAAQKSAEGIVCAGQRADQEGSSPSGAQMRSVISKDGVSASSAGVRRYGEPYTGTKLETAETAKGMDLCRHAAREGNRRAGCPS